MDNSPRSNFGRITDKEKQERRAKRYTPEQEEKIAQMSKAFVDTLNSDD